MRRVYDISFDFFLLVGMRELQDTKRGLMVVCSQNFYSQKDGV